MYLFELTLSLLRPCAQHTAPDGTTGAQLFLYNKTIKHTLYYKLFPL